MPPTIERSEKCTLDPAGKSSFSYAVLRCTHCKKLTRNCRISSCPTSDIAEKVSKMCLPEVEPALRTMSGHGAKFADGIAKSELSGRNLEATCKPDVCVPEEDPQLSCDGHRCRKQRMLDNPPERACSTSDRTDSLLLAEIRRRQKP